MTIIDWSVLNQVVENIMNNDTTSYCIENWPQPSAKVGEIFKTIGGIFDKVDGVSLTTK